jgi:tRNA acetyltransferase TAN1
MRQNTCGMSVVGSDYDQLKRYNLAEIYNPTSKENPKANAKPKTEGAESSQTIQPEFSSA